MPIRNLMVLLVFANLLVGCPNADPEDDDVLADDDTADDDDAADDDSEAGDDDEEFGRGAGWDCSAAFDSQGALHIGYRHQGHGQLRHASNASGGWILEVVEGLQGRMDGGVQFGQHTATVIGEGDAVHIAHVASDEGLEPCLRHSTNEAGGWVSEELLCSEQVGAPALAPAPSGALQLWAPHATGGDSGLARFTREEGEGEWNRQDVNATALFGEFTGLSLGQAADGNWHVAHGSSTWIEDEQSPEVSLFYTANIEAEPDTGLADQPGYGCWGPPLDVASTVIGLDASNHVHIVYVVAEWGDNYDSHRLNHAQGWQDNWASSLIDCDEGHYEDDGMQIVLGPHAMALDDDGRLHVAYVEDSVEFPDSELMYATNATGQWTTERVDWIGSLSQDAAIVLDPAEGVHIVYNDYDYPPSNTGVLRHATNATGEWSFEVVDN